MGMNGVVIVGVGLATGRSRGGRGGAGKVRAAPGVYAPPPRVSPRSGAAKGQGPGPPPPPPPPPPGPPDSAPGHASGSCPPARTPTGPVRAGTRPNAVAGVA